MMREWEVKNKTEYKEYIYLSWLSDIPKVIIIIIIITKFNNSNSNKIKFRSTILALYFFAYNLNIIDRV